jgi:hypothetical protein
MLELDPNFGISLWWRKSSSIEGTVAPPAHDFVLLAAHVANKPIERCRKTVVIAKLRKDAGCQV